MAKKFTVFTWMASELGLSGNQLVMFAYLFDITKRGEEVFKGGYKELTSVLNTTVPTVYNTLAKLEEKGCIVIEGDCRKGDFGIRISESVGSAA